jgi:hypothetical protein
MWHGQDQFEMNFGGISKQAIRGRFNAKALIIMMLVRFFSMQVTAFAAAFSPAMPAVSGWLSV